MSETLGSGERGNPIAKVMEERLFKKDFIKWLSGHWILYASQSKSRKESRIRFYCNGFGEFKITETPSVHSQNSKTVHKGKDVNKAIEAWFNLKD